MADNLAQHTSMLLPHLFRVEYTKMTAVLCRRFGLQYMETAEDIVSDTFLKATESWPVNGIPANPTAWLYTVAKNKTKDYLARCNLFENKIKNVIATQETQQQLLVDFTPQTIADSQLAMIFAVCDPTLSKEAQVCLALQVLCGFSVQEIANAFISKTETIKKRLLRARIALRDNGFNIAALSNTDVEQRQDTVLKTLYLLFNEGYFSVSGDHLARKDLCAEAMRLTLLLTENSITNTPPTNALLALMCFQASRIEARTGEQGEAILFEEQDKTLWDNSLIDKGNYYLVQAATGNIISSYHLQAAIAYWHTTLTHADKWNHILQLYNQLLVIEPSPVTALNRVFAYAKVHGNNTAIPEAEKLNLKNSVHYYSLLGYLYATVDSSVAINHYCKAISLTTSNKQKQTLTKEIEKLKNE